MNGLLAFLLLAVLTHESLAWRSPMGGKRIPIPRHLRPNATSTKKVHATLKPMGNVSGYPGVFGLDISSEISAGKEDIDPMMGVSGSQWSCLNSNGYAFAIIEGWQGGYGINTHLAGAVAGAWNGGAAHVDVYSFMCSNCYNNNADSPRQLVNYLRSNGVRFGMIWMDIEQCSGCWSGDLQANCNFITSLAQTYTSLGINLGIYASPYEWSITVGSGCNLSQFPLWWPDYDGNPSFSGFSPFAGWSHPNIKQFADSAGNSCGVSIDRNWYPN